MIYGRIYKLISGEYYEFEDAVLLDAPFAEINHLRKEIQQVYLGVTTENFIVAVQRALDFKQYPHVDSDLDGVEIQWIVPLCFIRLDTPSAFCLSVECKEKTRYFELTNGVHRHETWCKWIHQIDLLKDENYGNLRDLRFKFGIATKQDLDYIHRMDREANKMAQEGKAQPQKGKPHGAQLSGVIKKKEKKPISKQQLKEDTTSSILKNGLIGAKPVKMKTALSVLWNRLKTKMASKSSKRSKKANIPGSILKTAKESNLAAKAKQHVSFQKGKQKKSKGSAEIPKHFYM